MRQFANTSLRTQGKLVWLLCLFFLVLSTSGFECAEKSGSISLGSGGGSGGVYFSTDFYRIYFRKTGTDNNGFSIGDLVAFDPNTGGTTVIDTNVYRLSLWKNIGSATIDTANRTVTNIRIRYVTYTKTDGTIWRVSTLISEGLAKVRISSENNGDVYQETWNDYTNPLRSWITYNPGTLRAVRLDFDSATPPIDLGNSAYIVDVLRDTSGQITGWLYVNNGNLIRTDANFQNPITIASNLSSSYKAIFTIGEPDPYQNKVLLHLEDTAGTRTLHLLDLATNTLGSSLYTFPPIGSFGFFDEIAAQDSQAVYFVADSKDANNPKLEVLKYEWASSSLTILFSSNTDWSAEEAKLTQNAIVVYILNQDPNTGSTVNERIIAVSKTAGGAVVIHTPPAGVLDGVGIYTTPNGDKIYILEKNGNTITTYVKDEVGNTLHQQADSSWGIQILSPTQPWPTFASRVDRILLGQITSTGVDVYSYHMPSFSNPILCGSINGSAVLPLPGVALTPLAILTTWSADIWLVHAEQTGSLQIVTNNGFFPIEIAIVK